MMRKEVEELKEIRDSQREEILQIRLGTVYVSERGVVKTVKMQEGS